MPVIAPTPSAPPFRRARFSPPGLAAALLLALQLQTAQAQAIAFDIPAQPLAAALADLARQSGLQLVFSPDAVQGRQAPRVAGSHEVQQALDTLLQGSGLIGRISGKTVTVEKSPPAAARELSEVQVTDRVEHYGVAAASAATKTLQALIDTPTAITVLTERLIQDQLAETQTEVLRNAPSVTRSANQGNVGGSQNNSLRGFNTGAVYKDGLRFNNLGEVYLDNIESVEVVKGPASVLYGTIQPGGLIAYNRKKPQATPYKAVALTLGSESYKKLTADLTGPLGASGELQYRLVASKVKSDVFIDFNRKDATFIAPALRFQNREWLIDAGMEYGEAEETFVYGVPLPGRRPDDSFRRELFLGHPDGFKKSTDKAAYIKATRQFSDETSLTASANHAEFIHESYAYRPGTFDAATRRYSPLGSIRPPTLTNDENVFEVYGTHGFTLGGTRNRLVAGVEFRERRQEQPPCNGNQANAYTASVDAPDYSRSPLALVPQSPGNCAPGFVYFDVSETRQEEKSFFAQNTAWLTDSLQLLLGLRHTTVRQENENITRKTLAVQKDSATKGRLGMLYKASPALSLYASYSESFQQLVGNSANGSAFKPTEGRQHELGFKHQLGERGAFVTGSIYRITQKNLTVTDPNNTSFSIQEGKVRSDGAELEITGPVTARLSLTGGIATIDNQVVGGTNNGRRLANVFRTKASLWASYRLTDAWSLAGGAFYHGNSFINGQNDKEIAPATLVDMAATWSQRAWGGRTTVQINLKNLFDRRDYTGGFGSGTGATVYPEPGRQVFVRFGYEF